MKILFRILFFQLIFCSTLYGATYKGRVVFTRTVHIGEKTSLYTSECLVRFDYFQDKKKFIFENSSYDCVGKNKWADKNLSAIIINGLLFKKNTQVGDNTISVFIGNASEGYAALEWSDFNKEETIQEKHFTSSECDLNKTIDIKKTFQLSNLMSYSFFKTEEDRLVFLRKEKQDTLLLQNKIDQYGCLNTVTEKMMEVLEISGDVEKIN